MEAFLMTVMIILGPWLIVIPVVLGLVLFVAVFWKVFGWLVILIGKGIFFFLQVAMILGVGYGLWHLIT